MSIPVHCTECGKFVGTVHPYAGLLLSESTTFTPNGDCNHEEPQRTEKKGIFVLVKNVSIYYPETESFSSWNEYVGPVHTILLWLALVLSGEDGIIFEGSWLWWSSFGNGFIGDGWRKFQERLQQQEREVNP